MPQRSLASLVLGPVLLGALCLALACVAGARTDRLGDTLRVSDTLHVVNDDSIAASQLAAVADTTIRSDSAPRQQGTPTTTTQPLTRPAAGTTRPTGDSTSHVHRHAVRSLSPLAESIADRLVFVPRDRIWFTVASRGRRMLVDIGRVDINLKNDSLSRAAYAEAVGRLSPLPVGTVLRLRGPWGFDDARVAGFDVWNGRIVARLDVPKDLAARARAEDMLPATAIRFDSATMVRLATDSAAKPPVGDSAAASTTPVPPAPPVCARDTLPTELATRGLAVRDSIARFLTDSVKPAYDRLIALARVRSWWIPGCFGNSRLLVMANKRTPEMEFAVERAVLIDSTGRVWPIRFSDLRFHAHDPLYVFDADGDGVDDLAARGYGDRSGGLTIVRLDLASRRFVRLASGFAWEK